MFLHPGALFVFPDMVAVLALVVAALTLCSLCSAMPVSTGGNTKTAGSLNKNATTTSSPKGNSTSSPSPKSADASLVVLDNPIAPRFPYGSRKVRGVNLGGWLVLEVSPSTPFPCVVCHAESVSRGSPQASSTTPATAASSMSSRSVSSSIAARPRPHCRTIGTRGSPKRVGQRMPLCAPQTLTTNT